MLTAAQLPVLSDITISLPGVTACELYPFPIPDLACGMPVIFAGKYDGPFPEAITISGRLANGTRKSFQGRSEARLLQQPLCLPGLNTSATCSATIFQLQLGQAHPFELAKTLACHWTRFSSARGWT